jgi:ABC-type transport system substrate-binding protein
MPYSSIIKNVYGGLAERAFSYVNPGSPGYAPVFKAYSEDLNKAKELLQRTNAASGFQVDVFYDSGVPSFEDLALLVQDQLRKLNIVANLKPLPTTQMGAQRTARVRGQGTLEGVILSQGVIWLDDPDPNTDVWIKSGGPSNASHYKNATVDQLQDTFRFSSDTNARARAYEKIQGIVAVDVPLIPIVVTGRNAAVHPRISGVSFTADPHNRFWTMYLVK